MRGIFGYAMLAALIVGGMTAAAAPAAFAEPCKAGQNRDRFPGPFLVEFAEGSAKISDPDKKMLVEVAKKAKSLYVQDICLIGQTSKTGSAAANLKLAEQRTRAVEGVLRKEGVKASIERDSKGEAYGSELGFLPKAAGADRRVTVMFMK